MWNVLNIDMGLLKYIVSTFIGFLLCASNNLIAQTATITEETRSLDTYGFHTPNPVPILTENTKIFPYYKFEGYEHDSRKKNWKVIKLENEYIEVYVLPEIGGKVWGAIEKSTGNEFLYRNEVVKFRNISMRGPWTSGGIEFNFGIIGHHPSTATPVDYKIQKNEDGSVSCIVGNFDLPSRTYWQVEIRLEGDKAFFETNASWYNGTPLSQSYYNWMTGAAVATDDLEFFIPGNGYLEHNGTWQKWPIDNQGRNLAMYRNNDFGPAKSYHIVGDYQNYFGGYYHDRKVGFGHWSSYEQMPGQKLWLWALSRAGGIWEDLLTDTDGQYIEFQAGRLFNQYFPGAENPVSQVGFDPYVLDSWQELWFPFKQIGGMEAASEYGVLNLERNGDTAYIGINALQTFNEPLKIFVNGKEVVSQQLDMKPMEVFETDISCNQGDSIEVVLGNGKLYYTSENVTLLKRDFVHKPEVQRSHMEKLYHKASEAMKYREYDLAEKKLGELLSLDPTHTGALLLSGEAEYRKTNYDKALGYANKVLQLDTYDSKVNYLAGISYRAKNDAVNALEALGWAARSIAYRSVAFAQMAEIYLGMDNLDQAESYALQALDFNAHNLNARQVLLVVYRKQKQTEALDLQLQQIEQVSPINHMAKLEQLLMAEKDITAIQGDIQNEFAKETLLELALGYLSLGQKDVAQELLKINGGDSKTKLFLAALIRDSDIEKSDALLEEVDKAAPDFVFPYRREMIPVLEEIVGVHDSWKFKYYLAQNYLAVGLRDKATQLLEECGNQPDYAPFYMFRAKIWDKPYGDLLSDYTTALNLDNASWKNWDDFIRFHQDSGKNEEAAKLGKKAFKKFPDNYNVGLSYARALVAIQSYTKAISVLSGLRILPFEHASESKKIYSEAHLFLAKQLMDKKQFNKAAQLLEASKEWPEHLGIGAPYNPDNRIPDYLLGLCYKNLGDIDKAKSYFESVSSYKSTAEQISKNTFFELLALGEIGEKDSQGQLFDKIKSAAIDNKNAGLILALYNKDIDQVESLRKSQGIDSRIIQIMEYSMP
ncbi:DUF5107 domain-containing protein [Flagellimonas flava]|uniref:Tetratricopeptide repeat-containing protein n=1 Tax=Flagellimonas flava TaxID=570519 RepID=A0A1M5HZ72_9FLAO|nr:DUF5107 domain-containing protein [Allomuricauda flava]SHG21109.1 Tetratricopeptide repeat-containing protein [Allomuricauda flava]